MKLKYIIPTLLVGAGLMSFTSCSDDNDSTPTLHQPETFQLNTPALTGLPIDLASSDSIVLTWSQPDYGGFPIVTTYYIQYTNEDEFVYRPATETEEEYKNYIQADEPLTVCRGAIATDDINRNIMHLLGITSADQVPADLKLNFRVTAQTYSTSTITSNTVSQMVAPYFKALVAADPVLWYLTGSCIGDGSWSSNVPAGCMPMYWDATSSYNEVDGTGNIVWTGFLSSSGFKFRGAYDDNWAVQIGQGGSFGEYVLNDGGSGNISVPADGIYTVTLDTKSNTPAITLYDGTPKVFDGMALSGSFNGWGDTNFTPVTTVGENHDWYLSIDLNAGDEVKIKMAGEWTFNWGGASKTFSAGFYGKGENNGANLYISQSGTYDIFFNDILGLYRFVRK